MLRLDIMLISVKVASNAIQQYGLYHQTDATPHQHRCGVKGEMTLPSHGGDHNDTMHRPNKQRRNTIN